MPIFYLSDLMLLTNKTDNFNELIYVYFQGLIVSPKEEIRNLAARITSLLFCNKEPNEALDFVKAMFKELTKTEVWKYLILIALCVDVFYFRMP